MTKYQKLKRFNLAMAWIHGIQGALVLLLSNGASREITTNFLSLNETTERLEPATRTLFSVDIAPLVAAFFFISAFAHTYIATDGYLKYRRNIQRGINKFRWYEYSLSASLMIVLIAMLSGIFNFGTLLALFGLTAVMNLMGLMMEVHNQKTRGVNWLSYWIGVLAGIVPWIVIGLSLWSTETGGGDIPTFVYWIYVSLFIMFNSFAINMLLQYKKVGPWKDYLFGERVYIWLSLIAKSLLAWQIFAGALQPV